METKTITLENQRRFSCPNISTDAVTDIDQNVTSSTSKAPIGTEIALSRQLKSNHNQKVKTSNKFNTASSKEPSLNGTRNPITISALGPHFLTSLLVGSDTLSERQDRGVARPNVTKNEAEIIADFPVNQRHGSFPGMSASDRFAAAIIASGAKFKGQEKRRGSTTDISDSLREIRNLRRNSLEERRLQQAVCQLDRQSFAGVLEFRQKIKEVFKDYNKMIHRSPTADEWLLMKKSRSNTLQEKERGDIARRYSRRERHFRAPPYLHGEVTKIRSHAMMEAGLLDEAAGSSNEERLVIKLESLNMSRRHTISGDYTTPILPNINKNHNKNSAYVGRGMTLEVARTIQDVLELKADNMNRFYIDDFIKQRRSEKSSGKTRRTDSPQSDSDGVNDINLVRNEESKLQNEGNIICQHEYHKDKKVDENGDGTDEQDGTNAFNKRVNANDVESFDKAPLNDHRYTA